MTPPKTAEVRIKMQILINGKEVIIYETIYYDFLRFYVEKDLPKQIEEELRSLQC